MNDPRILYPLFALAGWTVIVLSLIPLVRVRAGLRKEIVVDDFKFGESASVPPHVSIPNRNLKRRAQTLEQQLRRLGRKYDDQSGQPWRCCDGVWNDLTDGPQ